MKAAVMFGPKEPLSIENVIIGDIRQGEVRIRVEASSLCHSDLHLMEGHIPYPLPLVLGHEAAGVIEQVGEGVVGLAVGDRVVVCSSAECGHCSQCEDGHGYRCDTRPVRTVDAANARLTLNGEPVHQFCQMGGFAEEMLVHQSYVSRLPEGIPLDIASMLGCSVITGVGAAIHRAHIRPGDTVAVLGCGGVGLSVIQGARIAGAERIIAVDLNPMKLDLASKLGATDILVGGEKAASEVLEMTGGGVDYAFEVIGLAATMRQAFDMLRKGGNAVLLGMAPLGSEFSLPTFPFLRNEPKVLSSIMGSVSHQKFIPQLARWYLDGKLHLDELMTETIELGEINAAYDRLAKGETARSVIKF